MNKAQICSKQKNGTVSQANSLLTVKELLQNVDLQCTAEMYWST